MIQLVFDWEADEWVDMHDDAVFAARQQAIRRGDWFPLIENVQVPGELL